MPTVTPEDVVAWADIDRELSDAEQALLQLVIDASTAFVTAYCVPLDEDDPDLTQDGVMRLAIIMQSLRLFKRRETPEGITAVFDGVAAMRVSAFDPDITKLIWLYRAFGVA